MDRAPRRVTLPDVQYIIDRSPYLSWLGIRILSLEDDSIEVKATWRREWVANPEIGQTQGGVVASLIDFAACYALIRRLGRPAVTIDLRTDYHRVAKNSDLIARGRIIKFGRRVCTCEAELRDADNRLIASGRGTFLSPTDRATD